jgi:uncharacterized protein
MCQQRYHVSFIEQFFGIKLDQVHIDLRFVLKSLEFSGGLKGCERQLGIDRGELSDIDGYYAVFLWEQYKRTGNLFPIDVMTNRNLQYAAIYFLYRSYCTSFCSTPYRSLCQGT